MKQNGESLHHLAYEVEDIEKAIKHFTNNEFLQISPVVPGAGHNRINTVWLIGQKKELIELVQKQRLKKNKSRFSI